MGKVYPHQLDIPDMSDEMKELVGECNKHFHLILAQRHFGKKLYHGEHSVFNPIQQFSLINRTERLGNNPFCTRQRRGQDSHAGDHLTCLQCSRRSDRRC
jgi:hypothetical protein